MSWTEQDVREMYACYEGGLTLAQVAETYGLTYERVRQLFVDHGLPRRSVDEWSSQREQEHRAIAADRREQIIALYKEHGSLACVKEQIDIPVSYLSEVIDTIPNRESYRHRYQAPRVPREKLIADLRRAAEELGEPLDIPRYRKAAKRLGLAAYETQIKTFVTWAEALEAAGVKPNPSRGPRAGRITAEECIKAVQECIRDIRGRPSYFTYSQWAKDNRRPSGGTVRLRITEEIERGAVSAQDGPWNTAIALALEDIDAT